MKLSFFVINLRANTCKFGKLKIGFKHLLWENERRRGRVVRAAWLWCRVAVSREFEARLRHTATGKLSLSTQQKMGTFFELGKDKAAKGEGWAPPFISCAQDTVEL